MSSKPSAIDGLLSYIQRDIKPFHTKIIEVIVEYVTRDTLFASFAESLHTTIQLGQRDLTSSFKYSIASANANSITMFSEQNYLSIGANFFVGMYVDISESYNGFESGLKSFLISAVDPGTETFIVQGDQTLFFPEHKRFTTSGTTLDGTYTVISSFFTGDTTEISVGIPVGDLGTNPSINIDSGNNGRYTVSHVFVDYSQYTVTVAFLEKLPYPTILSGEVLSVGHPGTHGYVCLDTIRYGDMQAPCGRPRVAVACPGTFGYRWDLGVTASSLGGSSWDENSFDDGPLDGGNSSIIDAVDDPFAPYGIIGVEEQFNRFVLAGDVTGFFPYSRQFKVVNSSGNNGLYTALLATLNSNGDTILYVIEGIKYPFNSLTPTDGQIITPGRINNELFYGFGFDNPTLCGAVPEMHAAVAISESLSLQIIDTSNPNPAGWDDFVWNGVTWDTTNPAEDPGISIITGYDNQTGQDSTSYDD